jgi:uncharacterized protein YaaR (DUF327 family)
MKINNIKTSTNIGLEFTNTKSKSSFSDMMNMAKKPKNIEQLKQYMDEIKKKGNRLILTQTYADVKAYKNSIKEYLRSVVEHMYSLDKNIGFWETQYFTTVDTINSKLEELTSNILSEQKEVINVVSTIDEIQGLLIDIYK